MHPSQHQRIMACWNAREFFRDHPFLAELIPNDGTLFECHATAPAPSKDYGQIQIQLDKIIVRWWKITLRNIEGSIYPCEIQSTFEDFPHDEIAHREITRIFGEKTFDYCREFIHGKIDWLSRLPTSIQIHICSYLNLDDISRMAFVSKLFRTICRKNDLWKLFYIQQHGRMILDNEHLIELAQQRGWRRIFFTNRLKLQMELRRLALSVPHDHEDDDEN